jgi:hypothetical protein
VSDVVEQRSADKRLAVSFVNLNLNGIGFSQLRHTDRVFFAVVAAPMGLLSGAFLCVVYRT